MGTVRVIKFDLSSPSGHERKFAALLGMEHNDDAMVAFETMLLKMSESSDPEICGEGNRIILIFFSQYPLVERSRHYVRPKHKENDSYIYQECHLRFAIGARQCLIWSSVRKIRAGCRISIDASLYNTHHIHDHTLITLSLNRGLLISTVTPRSRTLWRAMNPCTKRSPRSWCTTSRHLPLTRSLKCFAKDELPMAPTSG